MTKPSMLFDVMHAKCLTVQNVVEEIVISVGLYHLILTKRLPIGDQIENCAKITREWLDRQQIFMTNIINGYSHKSQNVRLERCP